ncbi:hypothetical protein C1645_835556 [Glomus cerebriforme]|uniref:Uncharacterized protein n=1 Tax=Glomus cerebriforme TaxID=658196 RepID=A0A397SA18_9GLOM|nr:hypothetical protein C1645_835556 [Glomus cerebriforme]
MSLNQSVIVYDQTKAKGILYPYAITKNVEFDEDETLNVVLMYLIDLFKDQEMQEVLNNFTHVNNLVAEKYKISSVFKNHRQISVSDYHFHTSKHQTSDYYNTLDESCKMHDDLLKTKMATIDVKIFSKTLE